MNIVDQDLNARACRSPAPRDTVCEAVNRTLCLCVCTFPFFTGFKGSPSVPSPLSSRACRTGKQSAFSRATPHHVLPACYSYLPSSPFRRDYGFYVIRISSHTVPPGDEEGAAANGVRSTVPSRALPLSGVAAHNPRMGRGEESNVIYVGGLRYSTDSAGLQDAFSCYGKVLSAKVRVDPSQPWCWFTWRSSSRALEYPPRAQHAACLDASESPFLRRPELQPPDAREALPPFFYADPMPSRAPPSSVRSKRHQSPGVFTGDVCVHDPKNNRRRWRMTGTPGGPKGTGSWHSPTVRTQWRLWTTTGRPWWTGGPSR